MEIVKQLGLSLLVAGALWCAVTAVMLVMSVGSPPTFRPLFVLRRTLATVPPGSVVHLRDKQLVVTAYNAREDREISVPLFRVGRLSLLRWRSAAGKSKATLRRRVDLEISCRLAALVLFTLPGFTVCLCLAFTSNWLLYTGLTGYLFLHRLN